MGYNFISLEVRSFWGYCRSNQQSDQRFLMLLSPFLLMRTRSPIAAIVSPALCDNLIFLLKTTQTYSLMLLKCCWKDNIVEIRYSDKTFLLILKEILYCKSCGHKTVNIFSVICYFACCSAGLYYVLYLILNLVYVEQSIFNILNHELIKY